MPRRRRPRTNLKKVVRAVTAVQPAAAPLNCDVRPGHKGVGPKSREEAQGNENQTLSIEILIDETPMQTVGQNFGQFFISKEKENKNANGISFPF